MKPANRALLRVVIWAGLAALVPFGMIFRWGNHFTATTMILYGGGMTVGLLVAYFSLAYRYRMEERIKRLENDSPAWHHGATVDQEHALPRNGGES